MTTVPCRTPTPGKQPTRIPAWKYDAVATAILAVVPKREPGVAFKELAGLVATRLSEDDRSRLGSVAWHVTTVKLELEVRGLLERVPGARPQRLVKTGR